MQVVKIESAFFNGKLYELVEKELARDAFEKTGFDGDSSTYCYVAYINDLMAGIIEGRVFWGTLYIRRLVVLPEFRMQGIGRQLVEAALAYSEEHECTCAFVETMHFQALKFYEKFGFYTELARKGFCRGAILYYLRKDFAAS
ncbi:MAG TPA: GNAT family N-acetyltransferase [Rhabdochlamydiaceae bacterium]